MTRRRITEAMRVRIFDRNNRTCHICGLQIDYLHEAWHLDHVIPISMGGADDESNMRPAHAAGCHSRKTRDEAPVRAKSDRIRARHLGAHKSKQPVRGWKKFDGTPVINPKLRRART